MRAARSRISPQPLATRPLVLFLAPLCNAHGKLLDIVLGEPFQIERWTRTRLLRTLKELEGLPDWEILYRVEEQHCLPRGKRFAFVVTAEVELTSFASPNAENLTKKWKEQEKYDDALDSKLKLLRLYKQGHIEALAGYWYTTDGKNLEMDGASTVLHRVHEESYFVRADEVPSLNRFLCERTLPFSKSFLQLAFDSYEESFRVDRVHLRFLTLMIAMEALFNVGQQDLRYRIARSVAVLLGRDAEDVETTFAQVRKFYDQRSQLVHTGKIDHVTGLDVWFLADQVREAIKIFADSGLDKDAMAKHLTAAGFAEPLLNRQLRRTRESSTLRRFRGR